MIYVFSSMSSLSRVTGQGITIKAHKLSEVEEQIFDPSVQVVSIDEGQFVSFFFYMNPYTSAFRISFECFHKSIGIRDERKRNFSSRKMEKGSPKIAVKREA